MGRRDWRTLVELVDLLPTGGAYKSAVAEDIDMGAAIARQYESNTEFRDDVNSDQPVPHRGYTTEVRALYDLYDLLLMVLYKGSGNAPTPVKRPVPAWQTQRRQRSTSKRKGFLARIGFD